VPLPHLRVATTTILRDASCRCSCPASYSRRPAYAPVIPSCRCLRRLPWPACKAWSCCPLQPVTLRGPKRKAALPTTHPPAVCRLRRRHYSPSRRQSVALLSKRGLVADAIAVLPAIIKLTPAKMLFVASAVVALDIGSDIAASGLPRSPHALAPLMSNLAIHNKLEAGRMSLLHHHQVGIMISYQLQLIPMLGAAWMPTHVLNAAVVVMLVCPPRIFHPYLGL